MHVHLGSVTAKENHSRNSSSTLIARPSTSLQDHLSRHHNTGSVPRVGCPFAAPVTVGRAGYPWGMSLQAVGDAALAARFMLSTGSLSGEDLWRFGVLQLLDDYESVRARDGVDAAAGLMADAPGSTGHSGLDAALAGLACWLADRDGWRAPRWALADDRVARPWWFVSSSAYGRAWAMAQSPAQFRIRGVFITETALQRV